jgi:hypothetical protein
VNDVQGVQI